MGESVEIDETAVVSSTAVIHPSTRGTRIRIGPHCEIYDFVVIRAVGGTGDIEIGSHCYINPHTVLYSGSGIKMGNYVLVGPSCSIVPANHAIGRTDIPMRHQGFMPSRGGVVIEDDVWIGANSTLLDGTHIERGCVIAAGSVVSGRIPAYSVAAGAPCRPLRSRLD